MVTKQSNTVSKQFVLLRCPCLHMFVSVERRRGQPIWTPTAPLSRSVEAISRRICINAYKFWHRWHWRKWRQEGWGEGWGCPALPCSVLGAAGARKEAEAPSSRAACQEVGGCPPSPNLHLVRSDKWTRLWTRVKKPVGKRVEKTVLLGSRSKMGICERASPEGTTRRRVGKGCTWREMLRILQHEQQLNFPKQPWKLPAYVLISQNIRFPVSNWKSSAVTLLCIPISC